MKTDALPLGPFVTGLVHGVRLYAGAVYTKYSKIYQSEICGPLTRRTISRGGTAYNNGLQMGLPTHSSHDTIYVER